MKVRTITPFLTAAACAASVTAVVTTGTAQAADDIRFGSPSGNIACGIFGENYSDEPAFIRCEISEYTYTPPPRPARCLAPDGTPYPGSYGTVVYLSTAEGARFGCGGGGTLGKATTSFLAYGATITYAGFTCTSARDGIRCGIGSEYFRISRATYEFS
ncbi:DUF6636 domain-containing protein [Nocardia sp. NPDC050712]|uniref:DUF6636 domain-containing protein n=1 Tax=Nocardia sp. NPDC050712 TaxID=3155518 RepID=UPI0033F32C9C